MMLDGRIIRLDYAYPTSNQGGPLSQRRGVKDRREPSPTIFLGNIPPDATRDDIHEVMKSFGDVVAIRIGALL